MRIPRNKRYEYIIEPNDVDMNDRATMLAVFNYIMRTSHLDSQRHKLGIFEIRKHNLAWVISRAVVEQNRVLKTMDPFRIVTWVSECNRIACVRNFIILDMEGQEVGHAVTQWSIINFETRQPMNLMELSRIQKHLHPEYPTIGVHPKKLQPLKTVTDTATHKVVNSDLDFNGHVNSLKYLQWMLDEVPIDFASTHQLWHFDVNYVHETHPHETAVILSNFGEDFTEFEIRNATQLPVCRAFMQWRKF